MLLVVISILSAYMFLRSAFICQFTALFISTGEHPHKCNFDGCAERFKDPSKKHKHMQKVHGYVPSEGKKRFKAGTSSPARSVHESLPPWSASGTTASSKSSKR